MFETELRRRFDELAARHGGGGRTFTLPGDGSGVTVTVTYQAPTKSVPEAVHVSATAPPSETPRGDGYRGSAGPTATSVSAITLRDESGFDRLGKRLGLNVEAQTGDPDFDGGAYLESWSPAAEVERLLADPELRGELKGARLEGFHPITLAGTRGLVSLQATRPAVADLEAILARGAARARAIAAHLRHVRPRGARLGWSIAGAVTLGAWTLAAALAADRLRLAYPTVGWMDRAPGHLGLLGAVVASIALVWWLARGRSVGATVFIACAPFAAFALPATLSVGLRIANAKLDGSDAEVHVVPLVRSWSHKPSRGAKTHYCELGDWRAPGARLELQITQERRVALATAGAKQVEVVTRRGALGAEWIVSMAPR